MADDWSHLERLAQQIRDAERRIGNLEALIERLGTDRDPRISKGPAPVPIEPVRGAEAASAPLT